jgi:hypothetical protein
MSEIQELNKKEESFKAGYSASSKLIATNFIMSIIEKDINIDSRILDDRHYIYYIVDLEKCKAIIDESLWKFVSNFEIYFEQYNKISEEYFDKSIQFLRQRKFIDSYNELKKYTFEIRKLCEKNEPFELGFTMAFILDDLITYLGKVAEEIKEKSRELNNADYLLYSEKMKAYKRKMEVSVNICGSNIEHNYPIEIQMLDESIFLMSTKNFYPAYKLLCGYWHT